MSPTAPHLLHPLRNYLEVFHEHWHLRPAFRAIPDAELGIVVLSPYKYIAMARDCCAVIPSTVNVDNVLVIRKLRQVRANKESKVRGTMRELQEYMTMTIPFPIML